MIVAFIMGGVFILFYYLLKLLIHKILISTGRNNVSDGVVSTISMVISAALALSGIYIYYNSITKTNNFEISNFKFEKSVIIKSPKFTDDSKIEKDIYLYYSLDLKNNVEDVRNFTLFSSVILNKFNNMEQFKELNSKVRFFDSSKKEILFDDLRLFKQNETVKVYGFIEVRDENFKWFEQNIPFEPQIVFKVGGGNSTDMLKYSGQSIENAIDISNFKEKVSKSIDDPNSVNLEFYKKDEYSPSQLKKNEWSEKRKKKGKTDMMAIYPEEIIDYLFFE
jgi:hypothetical protein